MKYQQWLLEKNGDAEALLMAGYPSLAARVLAGRGITTPQEAELFLNTATDLLHSPFLMRDMDKAVERIQSALAKQEVVAVYGDYDVDGITSTCLLTDYLRAQGVTCYRYIPRRLEDGYGLGRDSIRALAEHGVTLIITVDCGITGVEETAYAASLGVDLVITDHHSCKEILPDAVAVVNPHRPDCTYPFKSLAGVGVALKLVLALGGKSQEAELFARYAPLAAIGTVADVMAMTGENRAIVACGLALVEQSERVGLQALLRESGLDGKPLTSVQVGFTLSPRLNAAGRMGAADMAADLLLTRDIEEAERLARELCVLNRDRQAVEQDIFGQAIEQIDTLQEDEKNALVLAGEHWHPGVVGIVASRLTERYGCPSFMIHLDKDGNGKGSCRSYGGFNLFAALEACSDLLEGFGGHELAAGFTIRQENISAFRRAMNGYIRNHRGEEPPISTLRVDVLLQHPQELTLEEIDALQMLEPYGTGNLRPVFCLYGIFLDSIQSVGQNRHLKLRFSWGNTTLEGIFFSVTTAMTTAAKIRQGQQVDIAFYVQVNTFRGNRTPQLQILDIRPAEGTNLAEVEDLHLCRSCLAGGEISIRDASRLLPQREQFVQLWKRLQEMIPREGLAMDALTLLRILSQGVGGAEPFLRSAFGVQVFAERGLLQCEQKGEILHLCLTSRGKKVDLEQCPHVKKLRTILNYRAERKQE